MKKYLVLAFNTLSGILKVCQFHL